MESIAARVSNARRSIRMRRVRGLAVAGVIAIGTVAALGGCSAGGAGGAGGGPVTITLVGDSGPANVLTQKKVIALFEKKHPDIKVKFEGATGVDAEQGSILRLGQGDTSLDVATTEVGYEYQWFKSGWIQSLTPYFTKAELAKVDPHLVANETFEGQMLAIPVDNSTMYLSVNKDLLKQAGVDGPPTLKKDGMDATTSGVWTWEDVLAAAKTVHEKTGKTGILFPNDETWILAPMAQQLGGQASSPDGLKVKGYLDQQPWVNLATKWQSFFQDDVSQITNPIWTTDQFLAGDSAFQLMHIGSYSVCEQAKFDCDAAAQPYFEGGKKVVQSTGIAWALNAKSKHPKEAAEFMKFALLDEDAQKAFVDGDYYAAIPMLKADLTAAQSDPAYQEFPLEVRLLGMWQQQHWPQKALVSPANATIFTSVSDAFKDVRVGAAQPQQAVQTMTDKVDRDLAKYR
jgi:ABC-type glycerol-3-phosphate transport system substrate-binding protein